MIFDRHADYRYQYGNRHFWCRCYYVYTVGKNKEAIQKYIKKITRRYSNRSNKYKRIY